jgi:hypothetical protein
MLFILACLLFFPRCILIGYDDILFDLFQSRGKVAILFLQIILLVLELRYQLQIRIIYFGELLNFLMVVMGQLLMILYQLLQLGLGLVQSLTQGLCIHLSRLKSILKFTALLLITGGLHIRSSRPCRHLLGPLCLRNLFPSVLQFSLEPLNLALILTDLLH